MLHEYLEADAVVPDGYTTPETLLEVRGSAALVKGVTNEGEQEQEKERVSCRPSHYPSSFRPFRPRFRHRRPPEHDIYRGWSTVVVLTTTTTTIHFPSHHADL